MINGTNVTLEKNSKDIVFVNPTIDDGAEMWELVKQSGGLDLNSPYSYLMMVKFFNKTCIVAKQGEKIAGFVTAFMLPEKHDTVFVWQIGVDREFRGQGIGTKILNALLTSDVCKNVKYLEATISPSNYGSQSLFKGLAQKLNTKYIISECFSEKWFPEGGHEKEETYRIGPFSR